jgi:hypothetical protein
MDCDQLFLAFARDWGTQKVAPKTKGLIAAIQTHPHVDHVDRWPSSLDE